MTLEAALVAHLLDDGAVSSLVDERVFKGRVPLKQPYPLITYRRVSTRKTMTHDGPGLAGPRFEISCWASDETTASALRRAVTAAFDVVTTTDFRSFIENEMEIEFSDANLPRAIVDVRLWYDPSTELAS